jgi:uncharacterized protein (TIGR02231 family)
MHFMRLPLALCLLPLLASGALAAEIKATSVIDSVTVYPAGAEITRLGKVKLDAGAHTLLFTDLPAEAVAGSIRVEGKATGRLEIGSVDTRRVSVPHADAAAAASERRRVEEAIEKLKDEKSFLQGAIDAAEAQRKLIDNLAELPARPPAAGLGPAPQPDWGQLFALIGERGAQARRAIRDTQIKMREVDRRIRDLQGKLASLAPAQVARTEVKVFVSAAGALDADIAIRYQVHNASWTPYYDARLATGTRTEAPRLHLVRRAAVTQRTGESWDDVALSLSTARPTAGTAAPELRPMIIDFESEAAKAPRVTAAPPPPTPRSARVQRKDRDASELMQAAETGAKIEVQAFQAIYAIAGRVSVPSTSEAKRVQIDDMQLEPALTVRAVPKRVEKAYLYAKLTVAPGTPLLPGRISLFRDTTFVGYGRLPLLAPGEEHELGFGVDDAVRVRYALAEEKRSESGIITTSKTDARSYRITVKNLHERPIPLVVLDQVPVSQNADIAVELTGKTAPTRRDVDGKRGVLAWELRLEPNAERVIEFGYRATWPAAKKVTYGQGS